MMLDFGGGPSRGAGCYTVDISPKADIVHDLDKFPYPIKSNSASYIRFKHSLEHLSDPLKALVEAYRIGRPGCVLEIIVPWWKIDIAKNPLHKHFFHPEWFRNLDSRRPNWNDDLRRTFKVDWRVYREKSYRVWYFPLRKHTYHVWLEKK